MSTLNDLADHQLREALEARGHRFTEQRAAVYRFLLAAHSHPTADEVFQAVRAEVPGISLATVYKSLETLVECGLSIKLNYSDGSSRYDARTEPHHHARCLSCGRVMDLPGQFTEAELKALAQEVDDFQITGYRLELTGLCHFCRSGSSLPGL